MAKQQHDVEPGRSKHILYSRWRAMLARCYNPNSKSYSNYGSRGITVCDEWKDSLYAFVNDMGECPKGHTLDRIDNDGNYYLENCRWATHSTQNRNRRGTMNNIKADYNRLTDQAYELWGEYIPPNNKTYANKVIVGQKYGKLLVVTRLANRVTRHTRSRYACVCECGILVNVCGRDLHASRRLSCGCTPQGHASGTCIDYRK